MQRLKYIKITCVVFGLLVLSGISFYLLSQKNDIQTEQPANDNVAQNAAVKDTVSKEESLNPAQKYYKDNIEQAEINFLKRVGPSKDNDIEFSELQKKFIKATDILNEKYADNIDIDDLYYQNSWVKLSCVEGIYFYSVNSEYLIQKYGQYLSPAYNDWLKFTLKRENVMQDVGLIIPPDTLREYIISLEKFVEQYPEFVLILEVKDILDNYLMTYLEGIDNSPIFDKWNTRKMLPEFKASYEKFLTENKDSKYYSMVKELYNKSKANNFNWDRSFDTWLYEYHKKYFIE